MLLTKAETGEIMSDAHSSLSVTYFDPEAVPMPVSEPEPVPFVRLPKRKGRPPGSKNAPKPKPKKSIHWFAAWRSAFWAIIAITSVTSLYRGVEGTLGQSVACIVLAVSVLIAAFLLDRDWKKMRTPQ